MPTKKRPRGSCKPRQGHTRHRAKPTRSVVGGHTAPCPALHGREPPQTALQSIDYPRGRRAPPGATQGPLCFLLDRVVALLTPVLPRVSPALRNTPTARAALRRAAWSRPVVRRDHALVCTLAQLLELTSPWSPLMVPPGRFAV